ncbi:MAG: hypothetical protein ABSE93_10470 [Terriglobia bacterium]
MSRNGVGVPEVDLGTRWWEGDLSIYSILVVAATGLMTAQRTPSNPAGTVTPPVAEKIHSENHIHGGTLADDYGWLREKSNPEVAEYLEADDYAFMLTQLGVEK